LQEEYLNDKDEPQRLGKGNENLKIAVDHLRKDLEGLERDITNAEEHKKKEDQTKNDQIEKMIKLNKDYEEKAAAFRELERENKRYIEHAHLVSNENANIS